MGAAAPSSRPAVSSRSYRDLLDEIADLERPAWHREAACRWHPLERFFPTSGRTAAGRRQLEAAQRVCSACPVQAECARAGERQRFGVWGGTLRTIRSAKAGR